MNDSATKLLRGPAISAGGASHGRSPLLSDQPLLASRTPGIRGLVDTHHHMLPPFYIEAMGEKAIQGVTPGDTIPTWTPQADLAVMDESRIQKAVLSTPLRPSSTSEARAALARRLNEFGMSVVRDHPDRYAMFGAVPLPDIDASLNEAAFVLDTLEAPGLIVLTNYNGVYLGDAVFEPFWKEMNRRKPVIFVHPINPAYHATDIPVSILEFVFDTTRTITSLLYAGVTIKYPNITFIFSHGGGTLPFVWSRIDGPTRMNPKLKEILPNGVKAELQKFYWDTALCYDPTQLASLLALTDASKLLFGTDFPFAPKSSIPASLKSLGTQLNSEQLRHIFTTSALEIMPMLTR